MCYQFWVWVLATARTELCVFNLDNLEASFSEIKFPFEIYLPSLVTNNSSIIKSLLINSLQFLRPSTEKAQILFFWIYDQ